MKVKGGGADTGNVEGRKGQEMVIKREMGGEEMSELCVVRVWERQNSTRCFVPSIQTNKSQTHTTHPNQSGSNRKLGSTPSVPHRLALWPCRNGQRDVAIRRRSKNLAKKF